MGMNKYSIRQILGEGASSTVYLAHDRDSGEEVAIKVQPLQMANEPRILSKIDYEHIVKMKKFFQGERHVYIVLEKCDSNLMQFINEHETDVKCVLKIMRMVLLGIKYLHDMGVIHRDIKLGNILIKGDSVRICDMGLSCFEHENDFGYCGTKDYLAPEILQRRDDLFYRNRQAHGNSQPYGKKVDIYAAGMVFKVLLTGKKDISVDSIVSVSDDIKRLLKGLLEEEPEKRFTAEEALSSSAFSKLFPDIADFRMIPRFVKNTSHGEIRRENNFIQVRYFTANENTKLARVLKIEYAEQQCSCKGEFITQITLDGSLIGQNYLSNQDMKYFTYLCKYIEILCSRTQALHFTEGEASFTYFIDHSFLYSSGEFTIKKKTRKGSYQNSDREIRIIPGRHQKAIMGFLERCRVSMLGCICGTGPLNDHGSTINISLGGSVSVLGHRFISDVGWCIRKETQFEFFLNDGAHFVVEARRQTISVHGSVLSIERGLSREIKDKLKIARMFILRFWGGEQNKHRLMA